MSQVGLNSWPFTTEALLIGMKDYFVLSLCSKLVQNFSLLLPVKLAKTIKPTINALLYPANSNAATEWVRRVAAFGHPVRNVAVCG